MEKSEKQRGEAAGTESKRGQVSLMNRLSTQLDHRLSLADTYTKIHTHAHEHTNTPSLSVF